MGIYWVYHLGENRIQHIHLVRYILRFTVENNYFVLQRGASRAVNMISVCISHDIPPQMKNLYIVIPHFMHFCSKLEH